MPASGLERNGVENATSVVMIGDRLTPVSPRETQQPTMYIPPWPGLTLNDVVGPARANLPYPFSAERQHAFCVARSGIYHLFRTLRIQPGEIVLMPDYHSGNEVAAVRAAGAEIVFYPIRTDLQPDL